MCIELGKKKIHTRYFLFKAIEKKNTHNSTSFIPFIQSTSRISKYLSQDNYESSSSDKLTITQKLFTKTSNKKIQTKQKNNTSNIGNEREISKTYWNSSWDYYFQGLWWA